MTICPTCNNSGIDPINGPSTACHCGIEPAYLSILELCRWHEDHKRNDPPHRGSPTWAKRHLRLMMTAGRITAAEGADIAEQVGWRDEFMVQGRLL